MKRFAFNYLNFDTIYSSEGEYHEELCSHACFSNIFYMHHENKLIHNKYVIKIYTDNEYMINGRNNRCFLNKKEVADYVKECKKYLDFEFEIHSKSNYFELLLDVNATHLAHKFILTYMRYMYETPFSFYLYEAVKLRKEIKEFNTLDILDIYNLVSATVPCTQHGTDIHNIGSSYEFKELLPSNVVRSILAEDTYPKVNSIYPVVANYYAQKAKKDVERYGYDKNDRYVKMKYKYVPELSTLECDFKSTDFWCTKEQRASRYETYISNYNYLKSIKHE